MVLWPRSCLGPFWGCCCYCFSFSRSCGVRRWKSYTLCSASADVQNIVGSIRHIRHVVRKKEQMMPCLSILSIYILAATLIKLIEMAMMGQHSNFS